MGAGGRRQGGASQGGSRTGSPWLGRDLQVNVVVLVPHGDHSPPTEGRSPQHTERRPSNWGDGGAETDGRKVTGSAAGPSPGQQRLPGEGQPSPRPRGLSPTESAAPRPTAPGPAGRPVSSDAIAYLWAHPGSLTRGRHPPCPQTQGTLTRAMQESSQTGPCRASRLHTRSGQKPSPRGAPAASRTVPCPPCFRHERWEAAPHGRSSPKPASGQSVCGCPALPAPRPRRGTPDSLWKLPVPLASGAATTRSPGPSGTALPDRERGREQGRGREKRGMKERKAARKVRERKGKGSRVSTEWRVSPGHTSVASRAPRGRKAEHTNPGPRPHAGGHPERLPTAQKMHHHRSQHTAPSRLPW